MTNLALAGLERADGAPPPWMRPMRAQKPRTWRQVAAMRQPAANPQSTPDEALDAARRMRVAERTPSGEPQPPEVANVDASARVPNDAQPMSGEFDAGDEIGSGRPAFFPRSMPAPTGTTNNVGVRRGAHPFGAPTGMTAQNLSQAAVRLRLAALPMPDAPPEASNLAALPHFAAGGVLAAGGTGVVGEDGEEEIDALPGGGVSVKPLAAASGPAGGGAAKIPSDNRSAALAAMIPKPNPNAFRPSRPAAPVPAPESMTPVEEAPLSPRAERELMGYGTNIAAPPAETSANDAYLKAIRGEQAETAPNPRDAKYHVPLWRKIMAVGAGALAGGFVRPQDAAKVGAETAGVIAPNRYAEDEAQFNQQQAREQKQITNLAGAARAENTANADAERAWAADQAGRRSQAAADQTADYRAIEARRQQQAAQDEAAYRRQQLQDAQTTEAERARHDRATEQIDATRAQRPAAARAAASAARLDRQFFDTHDLSLTNAKNARMAKIDQDAQQLAMKNPNDAARIWLDAGRAEVQAIMDHLAARNQLIAEAGGKFAQSTALPRFRVRLRSGQTGTVSAQDALHDANIAAILGQAQ